ncbi:phage portal protein [Geodermatophilus sp. SYSU D01176]
MTKTYLETLGRKLDEDAGRLATLDGYWLGTQPSAFLSPEAKEALGDRLRTLAVNFPRLAVGSLAERLRVTGFRTEGPGHPQPNEALWRVWRRNRMDEAADAAHADALVYGRSFVIVWAGRDPAVPRVTVESARQVAVEVDPADRTVTAAVKRWTAGGQAHAVVYEPDRITRYVSEATVVEAGAIPLTGWTATQTIPNPLAVVPVVPLVNRGRLLDVDGVSEMGPVLDLADAIAKLHADAMVTSEFYARPRRWVTGLEIVTDDEGNPVKPFSTELDSLWQSEAPETKFGQFDAARLDGYGDLIATLTQEIGALTGLPPHYLGLHGDQPASADAIRSAEASLVARAQSKARTFGQAWADVARLILAVRDGVDPLSLDVETVWANPETRTPAQSADAAAKLAGIGVPLSVVLAEQMGWSPAQVQRVRDARRGEALDGAGLDLTSLLPTAEAS